MQTRATHSPYVIDSEDPRAPSQNVWDALSLEERARVLASLPSEFPVSEASPPEGDIHFDAKSGIRDTLRRHFRRRGTRVYVASELPVYYPGEAMFAPDIMAVCDVELHPRDHWVVSHEGKGLDFVLEIHSRGSLVKDLHRNVERLARLEVPEYFVWDLRRGVLYGFRIAEGRGQYEPVQAHHGQLTCHVLELDLALLGGRLRFYRNGALVPEADELIGWLQSTVDELADRHLDTMRRADVAEQRAEEEARRAEEEARRAEEEARRAEQEAARAQDAERRLAEALVELERLRRH